MGAAGRLSLSPPRMARAWRAHPMQVGRRTKGRRRAGRAGSGSSTAFGDPVIEQHRRLVRAKGLWCPIIKRLVSVRHSSTANRATLESHTQIHGQKRSLLSPTLTYGDFDCDLTLARVGLFLRE